jgi:hypothetical protein
MKSVKRLKALDALFYSVPNDDPPPDDPPGGGGDDGDDE